MSLPKRYRIKTIKMLEKLAKQRRAITVPGTVWEKPKPASVMLQLSGVLILKLMRKGMYLYTSKKASKL